MRGLGFASGMAVVGAITLLGSSTPAWASTSSGLAWSSPRVVRSGVPIQVASISPCPPAPTPGDTVFVDFFLSFGAGGGSSEQLSANPDGSWSGDISFGFSGVTIHRTTLSADCVDFNGVFGTDYAQYQEHDVALAD